MKVTIELIADAFARMFPEITQTHAFTALDKLAHLRSTKDVGYELQILRKNWDDEIRLTVESKATAPEEKKPETTPTAANPEPPSQQTEPVVEELPQFIKDMIAGVEGK